MTAQAPDPTRCPSCSASIEGAEQCPSCGLPLRGALAAELWDVDVRLAALSGRREQLMAALRAGVTSAPVVAQPYSSGSPAPGPTLVWQDPAPTAPRQEWTPQRVQNTLLSLGVLLLAVAALVATAVAYRRVGASGRAVVLLGVTALAVVASRLSRRRALTATAEATAALSVVLGLIAAVALRRAGLGDEVDGRSFWTVATAVAAAGALALARGGAAAFAVSGALLAQFPLLITAVRVEDRWTSPVLTLQVAALGAVVVLLRRLGARLSGRDLRDRLSSLVAACGALTAFASAATASDLGMRYSGSVSGGVVGVSLLAAVLGAATYGLRDAVPLRHVLSGATTALLVLALLIPAHDAFNTTQFSGVMALSALLVSLTVALLPRVWQLGPGAVGAAIAGLSLVDVLPAVGEALFAPLGWLLDPWSRIEGRSARASLTAEGSLGFDAVAGAWTGGGSTATVVALGAVTALLLALLVGKWEWAFVPVCALAVAAVVVTPLAVDASYPVAVAWDFAVGSAALLLGPSLRRGTRSLGYLCSAAGALVLAVACAWSVADETATVLVLGAAAVVCLVAAGLDGLLDATLTPVLAGAAAGLASVEVFAGARSAGWPVDRSGFAVVVAGSALVLAANRLRPRLPDGLVVEVVCAGAVGLALIATGDDAGWLSWSLAVLGLAALALALSPERRPIGYAGPLLLAASSWVRLADAEVHAPEPYVVPLALVALGIGFARRRAQPTVSSWVAYGPALTLALVPSLLASFDDSSARRPLLLAVAAAAVVLVGALRRLKAPLVVGAAVLALDAIRQLGAYVALLPRWVVIGALGALLFAVGVTFEQRRRDVQRIQQAFDRLG